MMICLTYSKVFSLAMKTGMSSNYFLNKNQKKDGKPYMMRFSQNPSKQLRSSRNQKIMARSLPVEVTNGTLEGDIAPGEITFFRLQSTADCKIRAYVAEGEVLPVATRSFGAIGVFAIPEMGRFYRHVLIQKNYPHHGAVAFGHYGKALFEVFKYIGVPMEDINYNQPASLPYPTENPFA